jgi:hypothetical protein
MAAATTGADEEGLGWCDALTGGPLGHQHVGVDTRAQVLVEHDAAATRQHHDTELVTAIAKDAGSHLELAAPRMLPALADGVLAGCGAPTGLAPGRRVGRAVAVGERGIARGVRDGLRHLDEGEAGIRHPEEPARHPEASVVLAARRPTR